MYAVLPSGSILLLARANWIGWLIIPAAVQFVFYVKDEKSRVALIAGWILYPFWTTIFL
jgi:hypothetical protein